MDFITAGIIASSAYDIFKAGVKISAQGLKERLGQWLKDEIVADAVASELTRLGISDEMSEVAITRRLEQSPEITRLIRDINAQAVLVAPSTITNVTQTHTGGGDNVAGNKIIQ
ncbi:GapS6a family protein [Pseudomonas sp. GG8]